LRPLSDNDLSMEVLFEDSFFVVASTRSPWARRRRIALADLMNEPWMFFSTKGMSGSFVEEVFRANGVDPPRCSVTSYSLQLRMHLLATGRFLTLFQGSVLRFNAKLWSLKALPIDLRIRPMPIAIFTLKNRTLSPVVRVFIEQARAIAKSM